MEKKQHGFLVLGYSLGDRFQIGDDVVIAIRRTEKGRKLVFSLPEGVTVKRLGKGALEDVKNKKKHDDPLFPRRS